MTSKIIRVYVAGPYTKGDTALNVRHAIEAANNLRALGFSPYLPHLTHFWHMLYPHEYDYWMRLDVEWLQTCDALFRIAGESAGADHEVEIAQSLGLPVFDAFSDIQAWKRVQTGMLRNG